MKKIVFLLKVFTMVIVICTALFAQKPDISWFASNSEAKTFNIANADQLAGINMLLNNTAGLGQAVDFSGKTFILTENIDLSKYGMNYNAKKGWIPIGGCVGNVEYGLGGRYCKDNAFNGIFDGNGKTISGLYINDNKMLKAGLFGGVGEQGEIKNLGLVSVNITGSEYVGGIVGEFRGKIIANCYTSGTIIGQTQVGGIAGAFRTKWGGESGMTNCNSTAAVKSNGSYIGGLIGSFSSFGKDKINDCYFMGTVSGGRSVGGIVGGVTTSGCYVVNSYNHADVKGIDEVGGIFGHGGTVIDCYSIGAVSGNNYVGGICGQSGNVINCYSIGAVSGNNYVGGMGGGKSRGISNCTALNPSIKAKGADFGRITGEADYGFGKGNFFGNVAFVGMTNSVGNTLWINKTATEKNGADITADEIKANPTIGGRFTKRAVNRDYGDLLYTSGWVTEAGKLPGLGTVIDMPAHLK